MAKLTLAFAILMIATPVFAEGSVRVGIATASAVKVTAVKIAFEERFPGRKVHIHPYKVGSDIAEQPVTEIWGVQGARNRLDQARAMEKAHPKGMDYWVSIENYIEPSGLNDGYWIDRAAVLVEVVSTRTSVRELSETVRFPEKFAIEARARGEAGSNSASGYGVTSGQVIRAAYLQKGIDLPADDWHRHSDFGGISRAEILKSTIASALRHALPCAKALSER